MNFHRFESLARDIWEEIPAEYREGIDGLTVSREVLPHPDTPEVFTLGECLTESYPSDWEGPETLRSRVVVHYGSFRSLARRTTDFDWEGELWETLTHELRHHLESLATEDALEGVDYAADQTFRRFDGQPFEPFYYRSGEPLGEGWYAIESARYLELPWPAEGPASFVWGGVAYEVAPPDGNADVAYLDIVDGVADAPELTLVLVRSETRWTGLRRLLRGARRSVVEAEREARIAGGGAA